MNKTSHIPDNKVGVYRFYTSPRDLKKLLDSEYLSEKYFDKIFKGYEKLYDFVGNKAKDVKFYSFYVGQALDQSLNTRIFQHINNTKEDNLRMKIGDLLAKDRYKEDVISNFMQNLVVGYEVMGDYPVNSKEYNKVKEEIDAMESELINANPAPLNNELNDYMLVQNFKTALEELHKKTAPKK